MRLPQYPIVQCYQPEVGVLTYKHQQTSNCLVIGCDCCQMNLGICITLVALNVRTYTCGSPV